MENVSSGEPSWHELKKLSGYKHVILSTVTAKEHRSAVQIINQDAIFKQIIYVCEISLPEALDARTQ